MKKIAFITGVTSIVLIIEWISVAFIPFDQIEPVRYTVSGYKTWFMSFSIPDQWIVFWCILGFLAAIKNKNSAIPFSMIAGSSMIFLGLITINFYAQNNMLLDLNIYQLFENMSCLWLLITGSFLIYTGISKFEIKK